MGQRLDFREIARDVVKRAALLDPRMPAPSGDLLDTWAACFVGKVWPEEALASVVEHYARPGSFTLMPGDVIAYCRDQPIWSSKAHARDFLDMWCQHPYSHKIEAETGIQEPVIDIPTSVPREGHKKYLQERLRVWVNSNEDRLVKAILAKRPA